MSATSSSPQKRPSMAQRSSSTHSLSSSGRPANATNKGHKIHVVTKHSRNVSHGKNLNRLGKAPSHANVATDGSKSHQRKKSGPVTPTESPKTPTATNMKRNSSHVALTKNTSHGNLRKNLSAGALSSKRNRSHGALHKLGAPPSQKAKGHEQKQGFFELGDHSSEEEDEEEWEDSATQSPELSRNHSKTSTPLRPRTPNGDHPKPPDNDVKEERMEEEVERKVSNPPEPTVSNNNNRSAPNLRKALVDNPPVSPALLESKSRAARAPPAMSTVSAQAGTGNVPRSDSARSLTALSQNAGKVSDANNNTPTVGTASSGSGGVSHFLQPSSLATSAKTFETGSDDDSSSAYMSSYKTQVGDSPDQPRSMLNKMQSRALPSRTNQRMELQRREIMRAAVNPPVTPGPGAIGMNAGSSVSLHSRPGSKAGVRNRSMAGEMKALKQDYEVAVKQLTVVRRFRNPMLESLHRLQENDVIPSDIGSKTQTSSHTKSRPQSHRGNTASAINTPKVGIARSPEEKKMTPGGSRSQSQAARPGRVQFQLSRQGSHDDINLTTSQGSPGELEDEQDGVSPEEALIRRIWESRVVYDNEGVQTTV